MDARWKYVLEAAATTYGLTTLATMRDLGLTDRMVASASADGMIRRVAHEVYVMGGVPVTERTAIAAAALTTGGDVSHATAADLLHLAGSLPAVPIELTVDAENHHPHLRRVDIETASRGFHPVRVHRYGARVSTTLIVDGIRCTDAAQTLIDVAGRLAVEGLEDAFERARRLGLVSTEALARRFELVGGKGRAGTPKVRKLLANARPGPLESKLEGRVWRLLRASALAEPTRQLRVDRPRTGRWYRIDFAWHDVLVAVEAEGFEWHGSRAQWKADRVRVAELERLGWRVLVVTWDDVTVRPAETVERIAAAVGERHRLVARGA
jgi:very-short-patch-repair endonuclease